MPTPFFSLKWQAEHVIFHPSAEPAALQASTSLQRHRLRRSASECRRTGGKRCAPPLEGICAAHGAVKQHDREANGKGKLPFRPFHRKTAHLKEFALSMDGFSLLKQIPCKKFECCRFAARHRLRGRRSHRKKDRTPRCQSRSWLRLWHRAAGEYA